MTLRIPPLAAALVVLVSTALTGCASGGGAAGAASSSPTPSSSAAVLTPSSAPSVGTSTTLTIRRSGSPAVAGPRYTVTAPSAGDRSVTVQWADTVSPSCGAVDEAVVIETDTTVTIALGRHAHEAHIMCPLVLTLRRASIPLAEPLGDRTLLEPTATTTPTVPEPGRTCPPEPGRAMAGSGLGVPPRILCPLTGGA